MNLKTPFKLACRGGLEAAIKVFYGRDQHTELGWFYGEMVALTGMMTSGPFRTPAGKWCECEKTE